MQKRVSVNDAIARQNVLGANLPIVRSVYILPLSTLLQGHFYLLCTVMVIANLVQVLHWGVE